jgi:ABC-2 type transport system ATP-binding protein
MVRDVIEVTNLKKYYGQTKAVEDLSFKVQEGEIFGMLGPNGAGKSTAIEVLVGIKDRNGGEVKVMGMDPSHKGKEIRKRIGVQLQTVHLFPRLTVKEILKLFASFYKNPVNINEVIESIGLEEKKNSRLNRLSGGQLQRVSVAIAVVSNGDVIFLDEPTAGLDPQSRRNLWDIITNLKKKGKTIYFTTHFMDEAQKLCDRVAVVDYGKIIALGSPQELIKQYFEESALEFVQPELQNHEEIKNLEGVTRVRMDEERITVYSKDITQSIKSLLNLANERNIKIDDLKIRQATLEDVFLKLTGRWIRD